MKRLSGEPAGRIRGQALAEFAFVIPVFLLVLFSIIEFGRSVHTIQMLNNAAREGARYSIVHGSESLCPSGPMPPGQVNYCDPTGANVEEAVRRYAIAIPGTTGSDFIVTRKWCAYDGDIEACSGTYGDGNNGRTPANAVVITVTYTYRPILGLVPLPTFTITGGSTLVINH